MCETVDIEYKKSNREVRQSPKTGKWWCGSCDAEIVAVGAKCPRCKNIQGGGKKVTLKRETSA